MPTRIFAYSLNILGPTLVAFGNHEQKSAHIEQMLSGERCGCSSSPSRAGDRILPDC